MGVFLLLLGLIACTPAEEKVDDSPESIDMAIQDINNLEEDINLNELDDIDQAIAELE